MADVTIGDLTESTTPASTDVIEVEVSSVSSRVTLANAIKRGLAVGSDADGDMYYRASSVLARLAKGTAGQVLTMNTGATAPEWGKKAMSAGAYELTDGATIAIDWDNGSTQYVVLGATGRTVTFANPVDGQVYRIIVIQDGTGDRTITTWPTIKWSGGVAPTLSTTAAYIDIVTLLYCNSVYYGDCAFDFRTPA